jgi:hypothetical protein
LYTVTSVIIKGKLQSKIELLLKSIFNPTVGLIALLFAIYARELMTLINQQIQKRLNDIRLNHQLSGSSQPNLLIKTWKSRQHPAPCDSTSFAVESETPDTVESSKECRMAQIKESAPGSRLDQTSPKRQRLK